MQPDEAIIPDDATALSPVTPPPQKFIRTFARDMATVQKGGTPDLVPLTASHEVETSAGGIPSIPFTPPEKSVETQPQEVTPPPPPPAEAVVQTYEQGFKQGAVAAQYEVPMSPAAVSWQASEDERKAVLARLESKVASYAGQPPATPSSPVIHEDIIAEESAQAETPSVPPSPRPSPPPIPASVPIAPPASPLSVPAFSSQNFTLGVPGEPVPEPAVTVAPPPQSQPLPAPPPVPSIAPAPQFTIAREEPEAPIHTYTTDFSTEVGASQASAASILAAEADARTNAPLPRPESAIDVRDRRYSVVAFILLVVGALTLYVAYARFIANTSPVTLVGGPSLPLFVDDRVAVSGHGDALMRAFVEAVGRPLTDGAFRLVYDPSASTSDSSIFNELDLRAPAILLRNIDAGGSMAGVLSTSGTQSPFFILSVTSYSDTFAGMLSWEPSMVGSLSALYPPYTNAQNASSTGIERPGARQGFADEVVDNHDTRIYRDGLGRPIVIYGYWDQATLVIARDEDAFTAILSRLANARNH